MDIKRVEELVYDLLGDDKSGHGVDHIKKVLSISLDFAEKENADKDLVSLIALLHDVDDYKLFGEKNSDELINAKRIMAECSVDETVQKRVCEGIKTIGYSKRLKGIVPSFIESMIVSDADMCDALGVRGIIRTHTYGISRGAEFFNEDKFPIDEIGDKTYLSKNADTSVCHFFEKLLRLKDLMLTSSGRNLALQRHQFMVDFLYQLFDEEDCPEWKNYLDNFLEEQSKNKVKIK